MRLKVCEKIPLQLLLYILPYFSPRPTDALENLLRAFSRDQALSISALVHFWRFLFRCQPCFKKCDGFQWPETWSRMTHQLNFKLRSNSFCSSRTSYRPEEKKTCKWPVRSRPKPSSLKRHIEKPWTQKSLKVFIQFLLRNVRKYCFMILWHIMRTGEFKIQKHNSAWRKLIYVPSYFLEKLFSIQFQSTWLSRDLKHSTPKEISQDLLCFWGILNYFYSQCHSYYIINGFYSKIH